MKPSTHEWIKKAESDYQLGLALRTAKQDAKTIRHEARATLGL